MAKFNTAPTIGVRLAAHPSATTNHEGGLAFSVDAETELYLRACTSLIEDKFYESAGEQLAAIRSLVAACGRRYTLQLASYVRNRMNLRSLPVVLLAEAALLEAEKGERKDEVRTYAPRILRRADEPAEVLAYILRGYGPNCGKTVPNALKKGISDALLRFDEYQLAKYDRPGAVCLKDVVSLVHPKPDSPERSALYRRVLDGELATPDTWEVRISGQGSTAETWNAAAETMGAMALLRNLRNFEQKGAEAAIKRAIDVFTDADEVRRSKQLPFRWYNACKAVTRQDVRDALHAALDLSLEGVESWSGTTAIFCDNSGSMRSKLSAKGDTQLIEVAAILGAMATALSPQGYRVGVFGDSFAWVDVTRRDSVLTNMQKIAGTDVGMSTNAWLTIKALRAQKARVDRVVLLSDMQCYDNDGRGMFGYWSRGPEHTLAEEWTLYRREVNPTAILYSIDLAGYGTSQFPQDGSGVVTLAGWSEAVLDLVRFYEGASTIVDEIKTQW